MKDMPKVRCERCGGKAKVLYVRDMERSGDKWIGRWRRVGYLCEACGFVKLDGVKADVVKDVVNVVKAEDVLKGVVEAEEREVFELKVLDMEEATFHILGCAKTLRSAYLLFKAKVLAEEDAKNVLKELDDAVKCLQETFTDLRE